MINQKETGKVLVGFSIQKYTDVAILELVYKQSADTEMATLALFLDEEQLRQLGDTLLRQAELL